MGTFHGLEMAKRTLFAQQSALHTTGHNIANANTDGYSRQRVNFSTTSPYPSGALNRPDISGQLGTGVQVDAIERIRDKFLDKQFRAENSRSSYWEARSDTLSRMEELLNEPSDGGLSKTFDAFWESLQDLASNPESDAERSVVVERGKAVTDTLNYLSETLQSIQTEIKSEIKADVDDANSLLRQINRMNEQIKQIEPHGDVANDLYDKRDELIDELSEIVNIDVEYHKVDEGASDLADGVVSIELINKEGEPLGIDLIDHEATYADDYFDDFITVNMAEDGYTVESLSFKSTDDDVLAHSFADESIGSLTGFIESYGYTDEDGDVFGEYPQMLDQLDELAYAFAEEFNDVHQEGFDLNGEEGGDFFAIEDKEGAAENISIHNDILNDPSKIAASTKDPSDDVSFSGNGKNALRLSDVLDDEIEELKNTSVRNYFSSMVSDLGVQAQEANRMNENTSTLRSQVDDRRMSVSGVSLDEEMSNMIKFQHAYNAAARNMTTIDEMLDKIINGMGLVGR